MSFLNILFSPSAKSSNILEQKLDSMSPEQKAKELEAIKQQLSNLSKKIMFDSNENTPANHQTIADLTSDKELLEEKIGLSKAA